MAGKPQHWKERNGRYSARVVIPPSLRQYLDNRAELEIQLGGDKRIALRDHAAAVASIQRQIGIARRKHEAATGQPAKPAAHPLILRTNFDTAGRFIDRSDDAESNAGSLAYFEKQLREGFLDYFGVPTAMLAMARTLRTQKTQENVNALQHGLELMCFSDRKLPSELREDLVALGMPEKFKGGALNTYRLATFGALDRKILPTEDDADVEFIEQGQTKSIGPEFVDMTPEDEARIRQG